MLYIVEIPFTGEENELGADGFFSGAGGGGRDVRNGPVLSISRRIDLSSPRSYSSEWSKPMSITTKAYSRVHACRRMSPPIARCVAMLPSASSQSNRSAAPFSFSSELNTASASSPSALISVRKPSARGSQVANQTGRSESASSASDLGPGPFPPSFSRTRNASMPRSSTGLPIPFTPSTYHCNPEGVPERKFSLTLDRPPSAARLRACFPGPDSSVGRAED